jgi:TonB family protein
MTKKIEIEKPPVIKQVEKPVVEKPRPPVSEGVINSKAINLVKPVYSSAARTMRIGGEVKVQVMIDEDGKVISANAVSGHPLLRDSAEAAAKFSKFTPTFLSKQKVKVTGIIIYNFAIQ